MKTRDLNETERKTRNYQTVLIARDLAISVFKEEYGENFNPEVTGIDDEGILVKGFNPAKERPTQSVRLVFWKEIEFGLSLESGDIDEVLDIVREGRRNGECSNPVKCGSAGSGVYLNVCRVAVDFAVQITRCNVEEAESLKGLLPVKITTTGALFEIPCDSGTKEFMVTWEGIRNEMSHFQTPVDTNEGSELIPVRSCPFEK